MPAYTAVVMGFLVSFEGYLARGGGKPVKWHLMFMLDISYNRPILCASKKKSKRKARQVTF